MKKYYYKDLNKEELGNLTKRPAIDTGKVSGIVKPILDDIKTRGSDAVLEYAKKFDGFESGSLRVSEEEFIEAGNKLDDKIKRAIETAAFNIETFHLKQKPSSYEVETVPGVKCSREYRPIENVGLYVPGGSAVLPSTMLMLGIPAKIAGCLRAVVCSPAKNGKINFPLLYAARICGIKEFYKIGGAQAIGLMSYGLPSVPKVDKIFGPGNQYVTAAKLLVSIDAGGCAIDMPAGPSEVMVIADENADPSFVASDLLSQAEHGTDSQAVLVCSSESNSNNILTELEAQIKLLPRKDFASKAIKNSFVLIVDTVEQAVEFGNEYAPEHLILNVKDPEKLKSAVVNAGSVFLGPYSPESAGDYASGTNHSLPTYGYAKAFGGITVESFMKTVTFQQLTEEGLKNISEAVQTLAEAEGLTAHKNAISVRLK